VGSEIPVSQCISATVRALGGIISSTTLAVNSSLCRGIPSALSAPSRVKFTAEIPADFYADRGGRRGAFNAHQYRAAPVGPKASSLSSASRRWFASTTTPSTPISTIALFEPLERVNRAAADVISDNERPVLPIQGRQGKRAHFTHHARVRAPVRLNIKLSCAYGSSSKSGRSTIATSKHAPTLMACVQFIAHPGT
jgi:hypothetical protein